MYYRIWCFFFFSSRRRHTRFDCDWSSDVCSSDLDGGGAVGRAGDRRGGDAGRGDARGRGPHGPDLVPDPPRAGVVGGGRSGEHTSELQSQSKIVLRLLLVKKKKNSTSIQAVWCYEV